MHIKELTFAEFDKFAYNFEISSYQQSTNYALLMSEYNYDYDLIGYVDEIGVIKAAALILIKKIDFLTSYGYSPKGFLIDYFNYDLLKNFTEALKAYYAKKLVFIKVNPELAIGEISAKSYLCNYNQNTVIKDYLIDMGYLKLKDNVYFESMYPRFNGIINMQEYRFEKLEKNTKNKIRNAIRKGLIFEKAGLQDIDILYDFIKKKKKIDHNYYKSYYDIFNKKGAADLFLVKIDFEKFLINTKELYDREVEINNNLAHKLVNNSKNDMIKEKMESDRRLNTYKNDIDFATYYLAKCKYLYIAGAFVIKYKNRVNIVISGMDEKFKKVNPNYFLHYKLIEYYKNDYKYLDLNGMTGDFSSANPYLGLNNFKLGFKPHIFEFIGEFDLVIRNNRYTYLNVSGLLSKEFNKV